MFSDQINSTAVTRNQNGDITKALYTPWGEQRGDQGDALETDRTFTGQIADRSTGLSFYNARYYDPIVGRFVSPDTIVPNAGNGQDYNRYSYVRNNPVRYDDPTGNEPCHYRPGGCTSADFEHQNPVVPCFGGGQGCHGTAGGSPANSVGQREQERQRRADEAMAAFIGESTGSDGWTCVGDSADCLVQRLAQEVVPFEPLCPPERGWLCDAERLDRLQTESGVVALACGPAAPCIVATEVVSVSAGAEEAFIRCSNQGATSECLGAVADAGFDLATGPFTVLIKSGGRSAVVSVVDGVATAIDVDLINVDSFVGYANETLSSGGDTSEPGSRRDQPRGQQCYHEMGQRCSN